MYDEMLRRVDELMPSMWALADDIFDHPEMGFHEEYAASVLTKWLEEHDWSVERGIGGLATAFKAVWHSDSDSSAPTVGLLAEYDALPMGHACGHHMQGPILLAVAQALRECVQKPFNIVYYGTPAEEGPQGKRIMMENGCFRDIDFALMTHAAPNTTVDVKSLAGAKFEIVFRGVAAHASLTPEKVRNPMDAVVLAFQGVQFLHSRVKEDVKFFCTVNECDGTPNSTDSTIAKATVSIRTYESEDIPELTARLEAVMRGAAMMTGTTVEIKKVSDTVGKLPSLTLNRIIMENAERLDAPQRLAFRTRTGSTDFAYVTQMMPAAVSRFAFVPEGTTSHSQAFLDAGKSAAAHEGMRMSAYIIAMTARDLIENPALLKEAQDEYTHRKAELDAKIAQAQAK